MPEYLVADIGATNARFSLANATGLVGQPMILPTREFDSAGALIQQVRERIPELEDVQQALLALAGPEIAPGVHELTNHRLQFRLDECSQLLACSTALVNDFYALAHGVPHFQELEQIGGHAENAQVSVYAKALLGPGSGLGMAGLMPSPTRGGWQVLASEGGHAELSVGSHLDAELWGLLSAELGYVSWESVLSGSGIKNLYAAMCTLWGAQAQPFDAAEISHLGEQMEDPICHQTLETFCAWLGAAAASAALTWFAQGGVYIGGGIVPQFAQFASASPLRRRFEESVNPEGFLPRIPIFIVCDQDPGLMGAYRCLRGRLDMGLAD